MNHPRAVMVTGSFSYHEQPVQGLVRFIPSRLWVVHKNITWACLAPEITLARDGSFVAHVTATDSDAIMWTYRVDTPAGTFYTYVPWDKTGYTLRELISEHHPGPRSSHRR